jgi:hypothetical protein
MPEISRKVAKLAKEDFRPERPKTTQLNSVHRPDLKFLCAFAPSREPLLNVQCRPCRPDLFRVMHRPRNVAMPAKQNCFT